MLGFSMHIDARDRTLSQTFCFIIGHPLTPVNILISKISLGTLSLKFHEYAFSPSMRHELVIETLKVLKLDGYGGHNTF